MNEEQKIIIFSPEIPSPGNKGWEDQELRSGITEKAKGFLQEHTVDVAVLQNNIKNFFINLDQVLEGSKEVEKKGFKLDQIEFSLQLGIKGQVGFLGTGTEASGQGGIKFIIKRT